MKRLFLIFIFSFSFIITSCDDGGTNSKADNDLISDNDSISDSDSISDNDSVDNPDDPSNPDVDQNDNDPVVSDTIECSNDGFYPEQGARSVSVNLEKLSWKACVSTEALTYDVFLKDGNTDVEVQIGADLETTEVALTSPLNVNTIYYWHIIAKDEYGHATTTEGYSTWFMTAAETSPICSDLEISPISGLDQVPLETSLTWGACTSQINEAVTYDLYLCENGGACIADTSLFVKVASDLTEREFTPTLKASTTYYWYIVAKDENGETSTFSSKWFFKTSTPGAFLWSHSLEVPGVISQIAVDDNEVIYVGAQEGNLYAIDKDGTEKWEYRSNSEFLLGDVKTIRFAAVGYDGTVFFQHDTTPYEDKRSYIVALNPVDGTEKWNRPYDSIYSNPLFTSTGNISMVVKETSKYNLVSLQAADGQELISTWPSAETETLSELNFSHSYIAAAQDEIIYTPMRHVYQPNIENGNTDEYVDSDKQDIGAYDTSFDQVWQHHYEGDVDGDLQNIWTDYSNGYQQNMAIDSNGDIYFVAGDQNDYGTYGNQNIYKIDKTTGDVVWIWKSGIAYTAINSNGVVIDKDGTVYVVADDTLFAIDSSTGTTKWSKDEIITGGDPEESSIIVLDSGDIFVALLGDNQGGFISDAVVVSNDGQSFLWRYSDLSSTYISADRVNITKTGILLLAASANMYNYTIDAYDFTLFGGVQKDAPWPIIGQNPQRTYQAK